MTEYLLYSTRPLPQRPGKLSSTPVSLSRRMIELDELIDFFFFLRKSSEFSTRMEDQFEIVVFS